MESDGAAPDTPPSTPPGDHLGPRREHAARSVGLREVETADGDLGARAAETFGLDKMVGVHQYFYGPVHAANGTFGHAQGRTGTSGGRPHGPPVTGRLTTDYVCRVRKGYVPPTEYRMARAALDRDHLVILRGSPGKGKRTGAVSLLRDCTHGPLSSLSPTLSVTDLTTQTYDHGHGYVVDLRNPLPEPRSDFLWSTVRDAVGRAGAWLVVTCDPGTVDALETVTITPWTMPDPGMFLRIHTRAETDSIDRALADMGKSEAGNLTMADWKLVADLITQGTSPEEALARQAGSAARDTVRSWFDERCSSPNVLAEVTALIFLSGTDLREFEEAAGRLAALLTEQRPEGDAIDEQRVVADPPPQHRMNRIAAGSLLTVADSPAGGEVSGQVLRFRSGEYRSYAAAELWARMDSAFWDAVRDWLCERAQRSAELPELVVHSMAEGMAVLATVAPGEVLSSYLEPWSTQFSSMQTQNMAVEALRAMSAVDGSCLTALRVGGRWASSGAWRQQWSAALAFSRDLGMRYPVEAAKYLSELLTEGSPALGAVPGGALGSLFGQLSAEHPAAGRGLQILADAVCAHRADRRRRERVLDAVLRVLSAEQYWTQHSAVFAILDTDPDCAGPIAELWAAVLRFRPLRRRATDALIYGIADLSVLSTDPDRCGDFGAALAEVLPGRECKALAHDLGTRSRRLCTPAAGHSARPELDLARVESATNVLVGALGATYLSGAKP